MKLLKRLILFTLASEVDFFVKAEGYEYKPYEFLYSRLADYARSSIRDAVLQLVETGEADKIVKNGLSIFRLTARGRERLLSFLPISAGQKRVWDRIWRIAILGSGKWEVGSGKLKQNSRTLRQGLRKMGFRKFSRGVYVSPLPISNSIKEYLLKKNLFGMVTVVESRKLLVGDDKQLASQLWSLEKLAEDYNRLITKIERLLTIFKKEKRLSNKSKLQFAKILNDYFRLLESDPGLPKKLLPDGWPADPTREQFLKLAEKIKQRK